VTCGNCRIAIATRRYGVYASDSPFARPTRIAALCDLCREALIGLGMGLREERRAAEPDTRPEWRKRLRAKDFSGSIA